MEMKSQAIPCALSGLKPKQGAELEFKKFVEASGQQFWAYVHHCGAKNHSVELCRVSDVDQKEIFLGDELIRLELAEEKFPRRKSQGSSTPLSVVPETPKKVTQEESATVSSCGSPCYATNGSTATVRKCSLA